MVSKERLYEFFRFVINGLFATTIHYLTFILNINFIFPAQAGISNFFASFFGILVSFAGNRYFVFRNKAGSIYRQFSLFISFYGSMALLNGLTLFIWTDTIQQDKTLGFIIGVIIQFFFSYIFGKRVIFA